MNKNPHNRVSCGALYPEAPLMGRFVSPWDTSGWYSVYANFGVGAKLHSNEEVTAVSVPARFIGADYIMTFNATADGLEDKHKQEVDFYSERDMLVAVMLDTKAALPEWIGEWTAADEVIEGSDGRTYAIYERAYTEGALVHIPGLKGEGNHFVVLAIPTSEVAKKEIAAVPVCVEALPDYEKRTYKSHLAEVFNAENALDRFSGHDCKLVCRAEDERDRYVAMGTGSYLTYPIENASARVVMTAKLNCKEGILAAAFLGEHGAICGAVLDDDMLRTMDGEDIIAYTPGEDMELRIVLDTERGEYDVWFNTRLAVKGVEVLTDEEPVAIGFSCDGKAMLDNLYVFDDTEIYAVREEFTSDDHGVLATANAELALADLPFASDRSLSLSSKDENDASAEYAIPAIGGVVTVETKIHADNEKLVIAPMITDEKGNVACRVAFYKNCVYATDGADWVELYEGLVDWQYYPSGNWYNVKVSLDTDRSVYTLMIDGAVRAKDFAFMTPIAKACRVVYTAEAGNRLLVNRIRVYDAYDFSRGVIPAAPVFDVTKAPYNAVRDGVTLDTAAIQKAIDDAAYTGGTVYLHDGVFFSGELFLRSDMTLFVDRSATLLGTQDHGEYPLQQPYASLCAHRQLGRGLVYGHEVSNVRVTGGGMLDGNGRYRFKMNDPLGDRRVEDARPDLVYITYSKGVTVEHVNFKSSCFWTVVPLSSANVLLRGLNLDCMNTPNRDGIDPVDCHDMTIYNCNVMAGDDGLCFKSSDPVGCYNIDVDDMMIQSLASGIKFGTDTYYCLKNAHIRGCTVKNVNRCGISLETVDGAEVEDVIFERIDMTDVGAPVYITVGDRNRLPRKEGIPERFGYIRNVLFKDLRFEKPYPFSHNQVVRETMVIGQNENQRIEDVTFENCTFFLPGGWSEQPDCPKTIDKRYPEYDRHGASAGSKFTVRYTKNFKVVNCDIHLASEDVRPEIAYFDYED
ncbi:MAG: hypothetical protein IJV98_06910 [Clostridia bacterium]|nr:hypothetical protein [Clostridia bacterium]